jgi:predicted dehydrogenase
MTGLRIGVVGLAGIGQAHLYACGMADSTLTAVCDIDGGALAAAAEAHHVPSFASYEKLLASGMCDAVVVATPPFLHIEQVSAALAAGLHVYCEKPLAPTARRCRQLAEAADAAGRRLAVGFQHRFQRSHLAVSALLAAGELGPVHRVSMTGTNWFRPDSYFTSSPWRARWRTAGGGTLLSTAIHQIDALVSFVGLPARVTGRAFRALHRTVEVEDDAMAMLEYESGARGTLVASSVDPAGVDRLEIHGDRGSLVAEGFRLTRASFPEAVTTVSATSANPFEVVDVAWDEIVSPGGHREAFKLLVDSHRDFADAIASDRAPVNHGIEASHTIELVNAIYLSSVRGAAVELPLDLDAFDDVYDDLCSGRLSLPTRPGGPS